MQRLTALFHDHHDLSVAATHIALNHESGMDVAILRGYTKHVRELAVAVLAEKGVRHGQTIIVPAAIVETQHSHDGASHGHISIRAG